MSSVLNVKVVVAAFNKEKALVGAFSVIVQLHRLIVNSSTWRPPHPRRVLMVAGASGDWCRDADCS